MANGILILDDWWRGFFYFFFFFAIHVILWRKTTLPKNFVTLLGIFIITPSLLFLLFCLVGLSSMQWFCALLTHLFLGANYIAAYPAIAARSPTIDILSRLNQHPNGISQEDLLSQLSRKSALQDRIEDLIHAQLVSKKGDSYTLSKQGNILATFFLNYRKFLGLELGGG